MFLFIYFFIRMSNFKRVFLETMFSKRVPETTKPIYLKFEGLNLHKKK